MPDDLIYQAKRTSKYAANLNALHLRAVADRSWCLLLLIGPLQFDLRDRVRALRQHHGIKPGDLLLRPSSSCNHNFS